jgi:hypothetical protein
VGLFNNNGIESPLCRCSTYEEALMAKDDFPKYTPGPNSTLEIDFSVSFFDGKRKDGKPAKRPITVTGPYYKILRQCELCRRVGTHYIIKYRWGGDSACWSDSSFRYRKMCSQYMDSPIKLCKECWSKVKPLVVATKILDNKEALIREVELLIRKKRREINEPDKC